MKALEKNIENVIIIMPTVCKLAQNWKPEAAFLNNTHFYIKINSLRLI